MKRFIKSYLLLIASVVMTIDASSAKAGDDIFRYIRQDGKQAINIDAQEFNFTNTNSSRSDLGGIIKNCSTSNVKCLNLSGYLIAIPRVSPPSGTWTAGGGRFSVVGRLDRGQSPVWLVQVSAKGDAYMFFSYSSLRGVESISLQRDGAGTDVAKTYFLAGERGLLAR